MAGLKSEEINVKSMERVDWTQSLWENRNFSVIYLLPHCFCTVSVAIDDLSAGKTETYGQKSIL